MAPRYCTSIECSTKQIKETREKGITFHAFPVNDKKLCKEWVHAMRRDKFKPSKYCSLCSQHFTPDCFEQSGWSSRRFLKKNSVPTIFNFPDHIGISKVPPRKSPKVRQEEAPKRKRKITSTCTENVPELIFPEIHDPPHFYNDEPINLVVNKMQRSADESISMASAVDLTAAGSATSSLCTSQEVQETPPRASPTLHMHTQSSWTPYNRGLNRADAPVSTATSNLPEQITNRDVRQEKLPPSKCKAINMTIKRKEKRKSYVGDFTDEDMKCPNKAKLYLQISKQTIQQKNREIRTLAKKNRRLQSKIVSMEKDRYLNIFYNR